jgi:alcohol dehydrogenase class IV
MINKQMFQFPITYTLPIARIAIGWGAHETVADECKAINIKKALIVTTGLKGTGIVDEIKQILNTNGVATEIYDKVTSNPKEHEVMEAYNVFKDAECDGVVSVGGGSSHDCGKMLRLVFANDGQNICDFAAYIDRPWTEVAAKSKPPTVPQVSVNTTGGTGAEATAAAMVTSKKHRAKLGMLMPALAPNIALVDPLLIRLMPQNIAAWTGYDAFAHGFDSFLSKIQSQYTLAISLWTIKLVAENLREFAYNRMNHVACENMCWAENMMVAGLHLGGGAGIVHAIGHQIGALTDAHHGLLNAVVTLPLQRYNEATCPDKFAAMVRAMGVDTRGMTKMQAADKWFDEVERLLADLNIRTGHLNEQFGLQEKDLGHIVEICSNDWCSEGNPRAFDYNEYLTLLKGML